MQFVKVASTYVNAAYIRTVELRDDGRVLVYLDREPAAYLAAVDEAKAILDVVAPAKAAPTVPAKK